MARSEWCYLAPDGTKFTFRLNYVWRWRDLILNPIAKLWVRWFMSPRKRQELEQQADAIAQMLAVLALVAREASQEREHRGG